jgi:tetratricopeptide (TPR) repeat protein
MERDHRELKREDYVEPACSCDPGEFAKVDRVKMIPQDRVVAKMNELMGRRDYDGCERLLKYWMDEAKLGADLRGQLFLSNEMIGHYRKTGNREAAFAAIEQALGLIGTLSMEDTISAGTTYVNAGTACQAFSEPERAYEMFLKAEEIYEGTDSTGPQLLGGLYNNMALTCTALCRYSDARERYEKALVVMGRVPGGKLEQAITYLNMADLVKAEKGMEAGEQEIFSLLDRAAVLLDVLPAPDGAAVQPEGSAVIPLPDGVAVSEAPGTDGVAMSEAQDAPKDGYYAFVCEKCAPVFSYYGYFRVAEKLQKAAEEIYRESGA